SSLRSCLASRPSARRPSCARNATRDRLSRARHFAGAKAGRISERSAREDHAGRRPGTTRTGRPSDLAHWDPAPSRRVRTDAGGWRAGRRLARLALSRAGVTQLAECQLPKLNVAGSNPVSRSTSLLHG